MQKIYTALANIVFLLHVAFGIWLLVGWQYESWHPHYLLSLGLWIMSWVVLQVCPLTYIEFRLRNKAGEAVQPREEFIHHYVQKFFGITLPMFAIYWVGLLVFILLLLLSVFVS